MGPSYGNRVDKPSRKSDEEIAKDLVLFWERVQVREEKTEKNRKINDIREKESVERKRQIQQTLDKYQKTCDASRRRDIQMTNTARKQRNIRNLRDSIWSSPSTTQTHKSTYRDPVKYEAPDIYGNPPGHNYYT
jgi:hypothetical protein